MKALLLSSWKTPRALYSRFVSINDGRRVPTSVSDALFWAPGNRRCAHRKHRTVTIQLLADVPTLGLSGSIHEVAPGYMRNFLRPKTLAEYIKKSKQNRSPSTVIATPGPVDISPQAKPPSLNIEELAERVAALPTLTFRRRIQTAEPNPSSSSQPNDLIYGSVTSHDIVKLIESEHGLTLVAPDAVVAFQNGQDRLRQTGSQAAQVNFRDGSTAFLAIEVVDAAWAATI